MSSLVDDALGFAHAALDTTAGLQHHSDAAAYKRFYMLRQRGRGGQCTLTVV